VTIIEALKFSTALMLFAACRDRPVTWHAPVDVTCGFWSKNPKKCVGDDDRVYLCEDKGADIWCTPLVPKDKSP
jgi:hypothetical protein